MTIQMTGAILFFILTVFGLIFSLTKVSRVEVESFPNRGRFFAGLILWMASAILGVFMSFPGYPVWFVPAVYPILQVSFLLSFLIGLFMVVTTLVAFPLHMDAYRREIDGRSDRIALLENVRRIASQPYPITELFTLALKELGSFLVAGKGAVFLINPSRREMYLVAQIGLDKGELSRLERFPMGQDIISRAAAEQVPFISGDLVSSDSASRKLILAGRELTMSAAAIPLHVRDRALGALLILSDKPYRFEKGDRMLLSAAAEAVAGVVETNRLNREGQRLTGQLEEIKTRFSNLQDGLGRLSQPDGAEECLAAQCRYVAERYQVNACRVVRLADGELQEVVRFEAVQDVHGQSESYRIAVIDAIRRRKMVALNQEAKGKDGGVYVSRSTLLCPIKPRTPGEYAFLVEAPGNGLPLTEAFLSDIEGVTGLLTVTLNMSGLKEADSLSQTAVQALLQILKIKHDAPASLTYRRFLDEIGRLLPVASSVLIFVRDHQNGYRIQDGLNPASDAVLACTFLPGEGPIGKTVASGEVIEFVGQAEVAKGWADLEPANKDFFSLMTGEKGIPGFQMNIPIRILDDTVAVVAVFSHVLAPQPVRREKGLLLLAAQLLSIKLSMTRVDDRMYENLEGDALLKTGHILNHVNNDLATIIGRAQLLERQSDISGRTRYTASEILRAAESSAASVKRLQEGIRPPQDAGAREGRLWERLDGYLDGRRVTGNLYMFENNRPVMLQREYVKPCPALAHEDDISSFIEGVLAKFVGMLDDSDEVMVKSRIDDTHFYISLIRGSRESHGRFDPAVHDFGDPDVLPRELADENMIRSLIQNKGEVSFDRFGRRPTYLSFRFPGGGMQKAPESGGDVSKVAGLKILAVDDQQMILDLLGGICHSLGLELTAKIDPAEAMELAGREKFDIVMVDLVMGRISGWDVAREVKRYSPETPVIMMTGWGIDISAEEAARGGVDFTLTKPFRIEQLTDIISRARARNVSS